MTDLAPLMQHFLDAKAITCRPKTLHLYTHTITMFVRWFEMSERAQLDAATFTAYLRWYAERGTTAVSLKNHYRLLKTWCRFLVDQDLIERDPFTGRGRVPTPSVPRQRRTVWTDDDIATMLSITDLSPGYKRKTYARFRGGPGGPLRREIRQARAVVLLLCDSAMRAGEAAALTCGDIRKPKLIITGKGGHQRPGLISMETRLELQALAVGRPDTAPLFLDWRGRPASTRALRALVVRLAARAGIEPPPRPLHAFRHYAARKWVEQNIPSLAIKEMMGHADLATTQIYTDVAEQHMLRLHAEASPVRRLLLEAGLKTSARN